ncbi:MAG: amino acid permease [Bacteroidaceae bacterium]|nr:amino acid permease [Bacteroidaceae bacterium]
MGLFIKKSLSALLAEATEEGASSLKRVLGPFGLIAFGVGVIVGAGLFSVTGMVAAEYTGPAITLSFVIAAIGCCFAGLCYAEFASMIPVSGSAYTYAYATMGELMAWIMGWVLVLEYTVACTLVSMSWSGYLTQFLSSIGWGIPPEWCADPWSAGYANLPAAFIVVLMSLFAMRGTTTSAWMNHLIVFLKVGIILTFIVLGWQYINADNYTSYIPENTTGSFGDYGWSGILRGAAVVFFAYIGFDCVSCAAQETKNPKRNMPIGILGSLLVCTILYIVFAHVLTGVCHYSAFAGHDGIAPIGVAIQQMGEVGPNGVVQPAYPWLNRAVTLAILFGYCSVILMLLIGQSRIFMSMSRDGLLPGFFCKINSKTQTPLSSNVFFMVLIAFLAAFASPQMAGELTSIGTLFAFALVCAGVLIIRRTMPDAPRGFKTPLVPYVPLLGIMVCVSLMLFLPADTWIRLVIWMLIGLDVYGAYGMYRSRLAPADGSRRRGTTFFNVLCITLGVLCIVAGVWHQQTVGTGADKTLFIVSAVFGLFHIAWYTLKLTLTPRKKG